MGRDMPEPNLRMSRHATWALGIALLKAAAPTDNAALLHLADRRGDVVKAYLVTKLPPERVLLTASKIAASKDAGPGSQVRFDLH